MVAPVESKVVLITGGSSGIGRTTALAFGAQGARVVICSDRNVDDGQETVQMIKKAGGEASFVQADVTVAAQVQAMIGCTVETYGRLDYAFNNAGIFMGGSTVDCTEEAWDRVMAVNLKGIWLCMKHEIPQMLQQGGGIIVNMSSVAGLTAYPNAASYIASKHGVVGLTKAAAVEYAHLGIRINAVCPAVIRTPLWGTSLDDVTFGARQSALHPIGRIGTPEDVATAVLWLCSDSAAFITGIALPIDGGVFATPFNPLRT
jgi:NAD(P)-dependent dehydrogenase (short-subunit alcohol dehydrogenase family)